MDVSVPALSLLDVSYSYDTRQALNRVTCDVFAGRVTMFLGPNGAGKTTIFSLLTRLLAMQSGTITLFGRDLATSSDDILSSLGIVFQQSALDIDLTVEQNLRYFAGLHGFGQDTTNDAISRVLAQFELTTRRKEKVRQLNGGHRRRVEIARSLMKRPKLLLLDEPTVGLDIPTRRELVEMLHALAKTEDMAMLWATHLVDEVQKDDDLVVLVGGAVIDSGKCETLLNRAKEKTLSSYFESMMKKAAP